MLFAACKELNNCCGVSTFFIDDIAEICFFKNNISMSLKNAKNPFSHVSSIISDNEPSTH